MTAALAIASAEFTIARRNWWVAIAVALMTLFSLVLAFAGAAPTGDLGVDRLTVAVASLTTLTVYLAPLIALLLSFDAVAGEVERGTLALIAAYPAPRASILLGKLLAHLVALTAAIVIGFGAAAALCLALDGGSAAGILALMRLVWTAVLLGAAFLGLGYAFSCIARRPTAAAGLAVGAWLIFVVLYDIGLLGALVADDGGVFTRHVFPWLLVGNPADAFRLYNLAADETTALASGLAHAGASAPAGAALVSLIVWPVAALGLAWAAFRRMEP
jgi:Cu-processing system permease protein